MRNVKAFSELSFYKGTGGTYACVKPTQETMHALEAPFKLLGSLFGQGACLPPMEWHVTVMYDKHHTLEPANVHEQFPMLGADMVFDATADGFEWWPGHNNKGYLVLTLFSDALSDLHELVKSHLELEHSFDDYTAHVTFAEKFLTNGITNQQAEDAVTRLNQLQLPPLHFGALRFEDIA
jgi:2'-5' RNA ligase